VGTENPDMQVLNFLPDSIQTLLDKNFGSPTQVQSLSGLTDATVWRIHFTDETIVVKHTTKANEAFFYEQVSPTLQEEGISSPHLWFIERVAGSIWLVLENIPVPFPRQRWLADAEQLAILRRLHNVDGNQWRSQPSMFRPKWTAEMTETALTWFPQAIAQALRPQLSAWRNAAQPLFESTCLISGDPNPANWRVYQDSTLAHFDWERFGWGTPTIDLAITVPGFGTVEEFQLVAVEYLQSASKAKVETLATELRFAKAWTIVELLSNFRTNGSVNEELVSDLVAEFPKWLSNGSQIVRCNSLT